MFIIRISATPLTPVLVNSQLDRRGHAVTLASLFVDYRLDLLQFLFFNMIGDATPLLWHKYNINQWIIDHLSPFAVFDLIWSVVPRRYLGINITIQCDSSVWFSREDCKVLTNQRLTFSKCGIRHIEAMSRIEQQQQVILILCVILYGWGFICRW